VVECSTVASSTKSKTDFRNPRIFFLVERREESIAMSPKSGAVLGHAHSGQTFDAKLSNQQMIF